MLNIFHGIHTGPLATLTPAEAEISANLRRHVEMLASVIGDRNILNAPKNLDLAADFIEADLKKLALAPDAQTFRVGGKLVRNIDAEIRGTDLPDEIVLVGAHYDSVAIKGGCPAANDNASGVAATLELARLFAGKQPRRTLRFVAFVNEEPPYFQTADMGSLVYAAAMQRAGRTNRRDADAGNNRLLQRRKGLAIIPNSAQPGVSIGRQFHRLCRKLGITRFGEPRDRYLSRNNCFPRRRFCRAAVGDQGGLVGSLVILAMRLSRADGRRIPRRCVIATTTRRRTPPKNSTTTAWRESSRGWSASSPIWRTPSR